jgi:hypothetical protein
MAKQRKALSIREYFIFSWYLAPRKIKGEIDKNNRFSVRCVTFHIEEALENARKNKETPIKIEKNKGIL